jgi:hypothetical protein
LSFRGAERSGGEQAKAVGPLATARPNITERIETGSQSSTPAAPPVEAAAAVAQKVVLYEEDSADPNGKRFVGSAIWRTETVTPGPVKAARECRFPGQP